MCGEKVTWWDEEVDGVCCMLVEEVEEGSYNWKSTCGTMPGAKFMSSNEFF